MVNIQTIYKFKIESVSHLLQLSNKIEVWECNFQLYLF